MKNFRIPLIVSTIAMCLLLLFMPALTVQASSAGPTGNTISGVWQGIVDGASGEGAFFYRMKFEADGTVTVTKQYGGNNLSEKKMWTISGDKMEIHSSEGAKIKDFDGAALNFRNSNSISYKKGSYEGTISPHNSNLAILHWIMILVVLIAMNELFRRSKWAGIVFYFILPFALLPVWTSYGVTYWFKWVKVYSVVGASIWFILMRFSNLGKYNFAKMIAALFLALNIAEAVTQDFSMGYLPNILNAIAGILSIVTLFYGWKGIHTENGDKKDLLWPKMTTFWIVAYDIWNWVFVYLNFPGSASAQFMVLLACTLPSIFIKKGTWLQARAFTLAAWFMYYFTFPRFTESVELLVPRNDTLMLLVALASILANTIYAAIYFRMIHTQRKATTVVI